MAPRPTPRSRSALPRVGAALCALGLPLTLGACAPAPVDKAPAPAPAASGAEATEAQADALASFSLRLFDALEAESGPNAAEGRLASPLSVEYALAMTANGAEGQTRAQMEATLGMPVDQLNECLHAYAATLQPDGGSEAQEAEGADRAAAEETLRLANSLWIRDDLTVKEPFLQACGRWYDAKVIQAPFDAFTPSAVNDWVSRNTDGMIERIVDEADPLSVMLLVNAAAFKGTWLEPYEEGQVEAGTFHSASGTADEAQLMRSSEELYLEGPGCTGFLKPYDDGRFAFAALLPEEGSTPEQLLASLDGPSLRALLKGASYDAVDAWLPKFETSYGAQLRSVLGDLGMVDAFDPSTADFSGIGSGSLYVGDVAHKAFIRVDEQGTRAAAATSVDIKLTSALEPTEPKVVRLDRPFAYLIVDSQLNVPVFVGVMDGGPRAFSAAA